MKFAEFLYAAADWIAETVFEVWSLVRWSDLAPLTRREHSRLVWFLKVLTADRDFQVYVPESVFEDRSGLVALYGEGVIVSRDADHALIVGRRTPVAPIEETLGVGVRTVKALWFTKPDESEEVLLKWPLRPTEDRVLGRLWPWPGTANRSVRLLLRSCESGLGIYRRQMRKADQEFVRSVESELEKS